MHARRTHVLQNMDCRGALCLLLLHLFIVFIGTEGACPSGWTRASGVCYKILTTSESYNHQENNCEEENGHLASIHSLNEMNLINSLLESDSEPYYIGLNDLEEDRTWMYSDLTQYDFSYWKEGEPNHLPNEDCVEIKRNGGWNDIPCSRSLKGICKREEPCDLPNIHPITTRITPILPTYESGSSVKYSCITGFTLLGSSSARCSFGAWQPPTLPHCTAKPCFLPVFESNALEISGAIREGYKNGSSINYYCQQGYVINGSSSALCLSGEWSPRTPPGCEAKPCALPIIGNTVLEIRVVMEEYKNGSLIEYYCIDGYVINGSSSAVCLFGEWMPPTSPGCEAKPCALPIIESIVLKFNATKEQYDNGSSIDYYCAEGYIINGSSSAVCLYGAWMPSTLPGCKAKSCALPSIESTALEISVIQEEYKNGSSIEYYCAEGYVIKGSLSAVCLYGEWIPSKIPGCQEPVEREDVIAGVPAFFVIGISCLLAVVVILCIVAYKLRKASKSRQAPATKYGPNEAYEMNNTCHKKTLRSADEFSRNKLNLLERIGTGSFGPVFRATAMGLLEQNKETTVQIAFLEDSSTKADKIKFRSMVETYGSMKLHPNVLSFYGYSFGSDPMFLILEYPTGGNLKEYLQNGMGNVTQRLSDSELITFALQIVMGLDYISSANCVHMDLRASRVLLNHDFVCKISDFRPTTTSAPKSNIYFTSMEENPSVKWMAPETVRSNIYSTKSNVWSFGVVLWEIMSSGSTPYQGMTNQEVVDFITAGCKLPRPCKQGTDMYATMMKCWAMKACDRPEFHELRLEIEKALEYCEEYDVIDEEPEYGNATVLRRH